MRALDRDKYEIVPIGITKSGAWLLGEAHLALTNGLTDPTAATRAVTLRPDPNHAAIVPLEGTAETDVTQLDIIFPVLHGTYGEDGTIQGLLEMAGVPFVGSGVVGSAVAMDKAIFKQVMEANDIPVLPWRLVLSATFDRYPEAVLDELEATLPYPMFTKPANLGSSVGIAKCEDREALRAGLVDAARYDRRIVVEKGASVRELEVSVLGNEEPIASVVGEIRPRRPFYDYVAKYISDDSELLIPAPLTEAQSDAIRALAVRAYAAVDCAGLGRVDLMLDKTDGSIYINEINTIPGFTSISMYPKLWEATGITYGELLDRLIELALERHKVKQGLLTSFSVAQGETAV